MHIEHTLADIRAREPLAEEHAFLQMSKANREPSQQSNLRLATEHLKHALAQDKPIKAVIWLHKAADVWAQNVAPHAACKKGCSHCCHIPVLIGRGEAMVIGKAADKKPADLSLKPLDGDFDSLSLERTGYDNPCPFLVNNTCSIFENRPTACRTLYNMDQDNLLCHLHPDERINVPYANKENFAMAEAMISNGMVADIRQWFPK